MSESEILASKELKVIARLVDNRIRDAVGKQMGFSVVIWNDEDGGRMNYISNCKRHEIKEYLSRLVEKWDTEEGPPSHEIQ